jgi:hypothetical protein
VKKENSFNTERCAKLQWHWIVYVAFETKEYRFYNVGSCDKAFN